MSNSLEYNFYYSGPLLFKTKINNQNLIKKKKLCKKDKNKNCGNRLAGIISGEYEIDKIKYEKIIQKYLNIFLLAYQNWYDEKLDFKLKVKTVWVNYMKSGDCNPIHIHTNCKFSSVLFVEKPKNLSQEILDFKINKNKNSIPGGLIFDLNQAMEYHIFNKSFEPNVGDFYIFPYNVKHSVNSFKSKGERISIAANFI